MASAGRAEAIMNARELIIEHCRESTDFRREWPSALCTIWFLECYDAQIDFDEVVSELKLMLDQGLCANLYETGAEEGDLPSIVFKLTTKGQQLVDASPKVEWPQTRPDKEA